MKNYIICCFLWLFFICSSACKKEWLDEKSDLSNIVPTSLQDMRLLLNNSSFNTSYLSIGEASSDDIYLTPAAFSASALTYRNAFTWQQEIFTGTSAVAQWNNYYNQIFTANVVLEGLEKLEPGLERNDIQGRALFLRARAFYELLVSFAKPYNAATAASDEGIPLRLSSNIHLPTTRASVKAGYDQVTSDLLEASALMQVTSPGPTDPSKPAALAALARVYLSMGDFDQALKFSNETLELFSTLIDYNTINLSAATSFSPLNKETIFYTFHGLYTMLNDAYMDPVLYSSYQETDLRKAAFFKKNTDNTVSFKGNYTGSHLLFGGFSTNEILLISAECYARKGNTAGAMERLNTLLLKRYKTGSFVPLTAASADIALRTVLTERRKELVFRGMRWQDLRRLNMEPRFAVSLTRTINGQTYTLPANDPRYVFPIPLYIINSTGISQNPR